ncbi:MAG: 50S ribosomal protein L21 [candidate division SR1 bacterium]|nr:50S ribosomal protein L21 [candidate division SR1 bacterium]
MYAVVEIKGHQYIVQEGDTIVVDNVGLDEGAKTTIDNVLLAFDDKGDKVIVGAPYIAKAKVECVVSKNQKGEKIRVIKFKRKNRYQRTIGFRPHESFLEIKKIDING